MNYKLYKVKSIRDGKCGPFDYYLVAAMHHDYEAIGHVLGQYPSVGLREGLKAHYLGRVDCVHGLIIGVNIDPE